MNDIIMDELNNKQINNINHKYYLTYFDKMRIRSKIRNSIFDNNNCTYFYGYITHSIKYNSYNVCIFYNNKKVMLKRLLYHNYIGYLNSNDKVTNTCNNICCININHIIIQNRK